MPKFQAIITESRPVAAGKLRRAGLRASDVALKQVGGITRATAHTPAGMAWLDSLARAGKALAIEERPRNPDGHAARRERWRAAGNSRNRGRNFHKKAQTATA